MTAQDGNCPGSSTLFRSEKDKGRTSDRLRTPCCLKTTLLVKAQHLACSGINTVDTRRMVSQDTRNTTYGYSEKALVSSTGLPHGATSAIRPMYVGISARGLVVVLAARTWRFFFNPTPPQRTIHTPADTNRIPSPREPHRSRTIKGLA